MSIKKKNKYIYIYIYIKKKTNELKFFLIEDRRREGKIIFFDIEGKII